MNHLFSALMGLAHLSVLVGLIIFYCRRRNLPMREWPLMVFLFVWSSMVVTAYLLSPFSALNSLPAYVVTSFIALFLVLQVHKAVFALPLGTPYSKIQYPEFTEITAPETRALLGKLLIGTLVLAFLAHLVICFSFYPVNADSLNYRLARVFWYVSNGSLLHPFDSIDKRLTFYPVDGISLYVPLALYGLPSFFFSLPSLFTWVTLGYVSYRFARALQAERLIALFAAWLVALTPSILIEASSTNDEILAATPLVIGMYFFWRWLTSGAGHYFLMAAIGLGLCIGTKLHIFFLIPIAGMAIAWFLWFLWRRKESWKAYVPALSAKLFLVSFGATALLGLMFLILNYISSNQFYFLGDTADQVLNLTVSVQVALQNLLIYVTSIILAPIADLNIFEPFRARELTNRSLNAIFMPLIAPFVDTNPAFYHLKYRFHGIIIPTSVLLVEYGLWPAFMWLLWPVQFIGFLRQQFTLRPFFFVLAATPVIWLLIWSCVTLYMEGVPTYFAFYLMCAAPAMSLVFAKARTPRGNKIRWWIIAFVVLTNIMIDANVAINNTFRGLWHFTSNQSYPFDWLRFPKPVIDEIQRAKKIQIAITHGKVYYFAFMHWNPLAAYYTPYKPLPPDREILHILTTPNEFSYGYMPIKITDKATPGLTYLGRIRGVDQEAIFAFGNDVSKRYPATSNFISLHLTIRPEDGQYKISTDQVLAGLNPQDGLQFYYRLKNVDNETIMERDWESDASFTAYVRQDPTLVTYLLEIKVRSLHNYQKIDTQTFAVAGPGSWCINDIANQPCKPESDDD